MAKEVIVTILVVCSAGVSSDGMVNAIPKEYLNTWLTIFPTDAVCFDGRNNNDTL